MQHRFLLQILFLAQHVSGITMPIIRTRTTLKTENTNSTKTYKIIFYIFIARNTTGSNHCIILLSS